MSATSEFWFYSAAWKYSSFNLFCTQFLWSGVSWSTVCARGLDQTSPTAHPQDELRQACRFQIKTSRGKSINFRSCHLHLFYHLHNNCPTNDSGPHEASTDYSLLWGYHCCCHRYCKDLREASSFSCHVLCNSLKLSAMPHFYLFDLM